MALHRFVVIVLVVLLCGCGGGGGGGGNTNNQGSPPSISNFNLSPSSTTAGSNNGQIPISHSLSFVDNDGNVSTITMSVYDSYNNLIYTHTDTIEGISGMTSGTITGTIYADTTVAGEYTFEVYLTDEAGLESNALETDFTIMMETNLPPIADAGTDRSSVVNSEVNLDGSNSFDNDGDSLTYSWNIISKPDQSGAVLSDPNVVNPSFTPDTVGTYVFGLVVSDGLDYSESATVTITVYSDLAMLRFRVIDAEYSENMEKVIMISSAPNQLHVYDPVSNSDSTVALPLTPRCVSVGPDGTHAAIGYDGWVSYVDMLTKKVEKSVSVSTEALDVVLAGNGYIYVFPTADQWEYIRCININTGAETLQTGNFIYAGTKAKLHPNGIAIYGANNYVSPSDIEKYSITGGTATYLYDSPYHGDYAMDGDLWISEDGLRIFTRSGNVFRSSNVESEDIVYNGSLSELMRVKHLDHCVTSGKVAAIPDNTYSTEDEDSQLQIYSYEYLNYEESLALPTINNNGNYYQSHGDYVFINNDGSKYFVIVTADATSGMLYDQAIVTY